MIKIPGLFKWIRQHVSWSLGLALFISLLVHLFVLKEVAWQSWFAAEEPPPTLLSAQLEAAPSKPVLKAPVKPARQEKLPAAKPEPSAPVVHSPEPVTEAPDASQPVATSEDTSENVEEARQAEIAAWHETDSAVVAPEEALPAPYQRVSTEFSVFVNGEKQPAGSAKIDYALEQSGQYTLRWVVEGRGLLKLLYPTLEQESRGEIGPHGLKPHFYRYAFGNKADKIYEASLDWETNFITLKTAKGEQRLDLPRNTQDILSFMYQFMFVPPLQEMHIALTNGRRLNTYQYEFEGEDTLVIADQTIQTVHIAHTRGETDEKIELWLASDYRFVPVKIRKQEKNGMVIEQVATRLITE
ncbi:MAG: DUF3108 domain-containing protein [Methylophilus sp.]|nr:DUF3108 domain-containing protein [Methylophilus sp.]